MNENNELQIRMIDYHSEDYSQEQVLRNRVLRIPLGMSLYDEPLKRKRMMFKLELLLISKLLVQ